MTDNLYETSIMLRSELKAKLLLAESATAHPDGTISMLRAGITHLWGEKPPFGLRGALVVRIEGEMGDQGPHKFDIRCLDEDGGEVQPKIEGNFEIPRGGGHTNLVLNFGIGFKQTGKYTYYVRVDDKLEDSWTINVQNPPSKESTS